MDCPSYRATSPRDICGLIAGDAAQMMSYWPIGSTNANARYIVPTNMHTPDTMTSAVVHDTESNAGAVAVGRPRWR